MLEGAQRECGHYGKDAVFVREEPAYWYMENAVILDVEATPTRISREVDATEPGARRQSPVMARIGSPADQNRLPLCPQHTTF
jgi:hypothetical protein